MIILLLALVASEPTSPWSDAGGFALDHGTVIAGAVAGGADVLPSRIGGVVTATHAFLPRLDASLSLAAGAVTNEIATIVPTLAVRWAPWQRERQGITLRLSVALPVSVLVANEVTSTGASPHAQAALEGVPVELQGAYSHFLGRRYELGAILPVRIFPATTGEISYGVGVGARLGLHIEQRFIVALEITARLEHTTYAPTGFGVGDGLFIIPAGALSFSAAL